MMRRRLHWRKLKPAEVMILDIGFMTQSISDSLPLDDIFVLPIRREWWSIHPRTLYLWCWRTVLTGKPMSSYFDAVFSQIQPKVCLCGTDNNPWILKLAERFPSAHWIVMQNGVRFPRSESGTMLGKNVSFDVEYWSFGQWEIDCYRSSNVTFSISRPAGSIKNSLWMTIRNQRKTWREFDVCLMSQYRDNFLPRLVIDEFSQSTEHLSEWMKNNLKKRVVVAGAATNEGESRRERMFFSSILPEALFMPGSADNRWQSYELADRSQVCLASNSTAGLEALARGNRVLLSGSLLQASMPILSQKFWVDPFCSQDDFNRALSELLTMSDEDFWAAVPENELDYVMKGSPKPSASQMLQSRVHELLEGNS